MNGTTIAGRVNLENVGLDWQIQGTGDFNRDGQSDILWRHQGGQVHAWLMNGTTIAGRVNLENVGLDWQIQNGIKNVILPPDNTTGSARPITFNNGQGKLAFTANDFVGTVDPNDFYRFSLNQRSNFNLILDGLSADANVELLNSSGGSITTSNYWGTTPDSITRTLDAGTYYIRVYQGRGAANTNYKLGVTADLNWADRIFDNKSISLERTDSNGYGSSQRIDPTKPTWIVIHGWNGSSSTGEIMGLANALGLDGSQVLTLDWHELSNTGKVDVGKAADWIQRVAGWAAKKLSDWGFTSNSNLNIAGHSLGSYVAYEIAKNMPGSVKTLVALDPAKELWGGYDTSQISFNDRRYTKYSVAFYGSSAGSDPRAVTADATFSMGFGKGVDPEKNHGRVTNFFANIVRLSRTDDRVRRFFGLENLNSNSYHPWVDNQFSAFGGYGVSGVQYLYEGRIEARLDGNNSFLKSFSYYDREHNKVEKLFW
jgi:pimeloyl-ACP methyl ester carboxylesterase